MVQSSSFTKKKMKLMIVEDDKALAKGIELALSEKENEITVCND